MVFLFVVVLSYNCKLVIFKLKCVNWLGFGVMVKIGMFFICLSFVLLVFLIVEIMVKMLEVDVKSVFKLFLNSFIFKFVFMLLINLLKCICIGCVNL